MLKPAIKLYNREGDKCAYWLVYDKSIEGFSQPVHHRPRYNLRPKTSFLVPAPSIRKLAVYTKLQSNCNGVQYSDHKKESVYRISASTNNYEMNHTNQEKYVSPVCLALKQNNKQRP